MTNLYSTGGRVALASNSTATAASYTAGFKASVPSDAFEMGGSPRGARYRGVKVHVICAEASITTIGGRLWAFSPAYASAVPGSPKGYDAQCLATITGTSASSLTAPNGHAHSGKYICTTLAVTTTTTATTPKGPGAVLNMALGSAGAQAFSPADDATAAFVIVPDVGNASHVYLELFDSAGNATNGLIEGFV